MKLRRLLAMVMALALAGMAAVAEDIPDSETESLFGIPMGDGSGKDPLTIMLIDCGVALNGDEPFDGSVVSQTGDPQGLTLSLAGQAGAILGDGCLLTLGYDSEPEMFDSEPVPAADHEKVSAQAFALRGLKEEKRLFSSDAPRAIKALAERIAEAGWAETYEIHVVILTGGCVNFFTAPNGYDGAALTAGVDSLRAAGAQIRAFGFDLSDSVPADRQITADNFAGGEYTSIPVGEGGVAQALRDEYIPAVAAALAEIGGWKTEPLDRIAIEEEDIAVFVTDEGVSVLSGGDPEVGAATGGLRLFHEKVILPLDLAKSRLDADGDGVMDISPLEAGERKQALIDGILDLPAGIEASSDDTGVVTVEMVTDVLNVTGAGGGSARIVIDSPSQPGETLALTVEVIDRNVYFEEVESPVQMRGDILIARAASNLAASVERKTGEAWTADQSGVTLTSDGRTLYARFNEPGTYRITAWTEQDGERRCVTSREYTARIEIDPISDVALTAPYFKAQPGQTVKVTSGGEYADLSALRVSVEPEGLAEAFSDPSRGEIFILPLKTGRGRVVITSEDGEPAAEFGLKITALTGRFTFWLFAALIPLGLIGMGLFAGLLLKRKRR